MSPDEQPVIGRTYKESVPTWPAPRQAPEGAPNIVMIVLDDVGFADLGCYGSEIDTPRIDELAAGGLRYNNFHTTALCSPTRACLLTGRNHHSVGMGVVSNWDTGFPGYRGRISRRAGTMAEILRTVGYNTFAVGKWHLTPPEETTAAGPFEQWPLQRGFDRFYGFLDGATDQYAPDLVVDNHRVDAPRRPGYHLSEDLVDQSIALVLDQQSAYPEKPFLLYLCFGTAHYPLQAPSTFIEKYRGRYDRGWDQIRADRLSRQKQLGIVPEDTALPPRNTGVLAWDELPEDERRVAARLQEAYAGMIDHTDVHIGRLLDELTRIGARDNTLVLLISDNGGTLEGGPLGSINYLRYVNALPSSSDDLLGALDDIGGPSTSPMYPMGWGMASNTPLKRYKQNTHGGGIRDPLIVSWPARIRDRGAIRGQFHHAVDILPTVLDLSGVETPAEIDGLPQFPLEGVSMAASFGDASAPSRKEVQYFEMLGNRAVWSNGWKAVAYHAPGSDFDDDRWELYHLEEDFAENRDLAEHQPEKLRELVELWWREAERHHVLPLDDRIMERFLVPKPRPITSRQTFSYFRGAHIPSAAMADIKDVSYVLRADVEPAGDGMIVACGDRFSGYALFIKNGRLVHDYNCAGMHYTVRSDVEVPLEPTALEYRFHKTGERQGRGELYIDDVRVGHVDVEQSLGIHISPSGLTVGHSPVSPVSDEYEPPFPFTGTLHRVTVRLGDDGGGFTPDSISALGD